MKAAALTTSAFLLFATLAPAVEIDGTVRDASGKNATVVTQSDLVPNTGDEVEFFFKMPGTGDEITVGTGRVSEAGVDSIEVTIQEASGAVEKNQLARIYSEHPRKKGATRASTAATRPGAAKPDGKEAKRETVSPEAENGVRTGQGEVVAPAGGKRGMRSALAKSADIDTDCRADLKRLGAGLLAYRIIHNDRSPKKLSDLYYEGLVESLGDFTCVGTIAETASKIDANADYTLKGLPHTRDLLVREKAPREGKREVLAIFADGTIKPVAVAAAPGTAPAATKPSQAPVRASKPLPPKRRARIGPPAKRPQIAGQRPVEPPAPRGADQATVAAQGADAPRYLGCFKDQGATDGVEGRDLDGAMSSDGAMTSAVCIEECRAQGFAYAGTQYSSYCFCGNRYGASGPADNCNTPCAGKPEEICGGGWANSVYATGIDRSVAGRVIRVQTASYGQNCGAAAANVTDHAKQTCDGKRDCEYRVDYTLIGDPAPGCAKDYVIGWTCGAHQKVSYLSAAPEAGLGSVLRLSCPPPKGALTGPAPVAVTATGGSGVIRERTQPVVVTRQATGGSSTLTVPNEPVARRQRPLVRTAANDGSGTRMAALAANLDQAQLAIDDLVARNRELDMKLQAIEARLATAEAQLDLRLAESARSIARDALRYASDYGRDVFKLHSLEQAELQARELSARSPDYRKLLKAVQAQSARRHQAAEENFARYAQAVAKLSEIGDARRQQALNDLEASGLNEQAQAALGLIRDQLAQYVHSRRADPGRWKLAFKQRFETAAE